MVNSLHTLQQLFWIVISVHVVPGYFVFKSVVRYALSFLHSLL